MIEENCFEIAKALAKEERELGIEVWAKNCLNINEDGQRIKTLKTYDLPRDMVHRWMWVVHWRYCWFVCRYPRLRISIDISHYDKTRGIPFGYQSALSKLISAKAQVTKIQNAIAQYTEEKKKELFFNIEEDPIYLKAIKKLEDKKQKVIEAEMAVSELVKQHKTNQ